MTAITGTLAVRLNICSSLNMMSDAVTVPPGLLMRTMRAFTSESSAAFFSSSRKRTSSGTRGGGAPMTRVWVWPSSLRNPETSVRRIFALPWPSTVRSSSGLIRGVRSIEINEQPVASKRTTRAITDLRMRRVYRGG